MTAERNDGQGTTRRTVVMGAAGLAAAGLSACGSNGGGAVSSATAAAGSAGSSAASAASSAVSSAASQASSVASSATSAAKVLGKTADVPVGGGKLYPDDKVVVTQVKAGEFAAVSAVCTHQGCLVSAPADGQIPCRCHGSVFNLDGSVKTGPASTALPSVPVTVSGDSIALS